MEEANAIWSRMRSLVGNSKLELSAVQVKELSLLWRRYVQALPPEWRDRVLVVVGGVAEEIGKSVVHLNEVPELIERSQKFREFIVELLKAPV